MCFRPKRKITWDEPAQRAQSFHHDDRKAIGDYLGKKIADPKRRGEVENLVLAAFVGLRDELYLRFDGPPREPVLVLPKRSESAVKKSVQTTIERWYYGAFKFCSSGLDQEYTLDHACYLFEKFGVRSRRIQANTRSALERLARGNNSELAKVIAEVIERSEAVRARPSKLEKARRVVTFDWLQYKALQKRGDKSAMIERPKP